MNPLMIWDNPLIIRGIRTRLRLPLAVSWALVTIVASAFLYIIVYGNAIKDSNTTEAEAARQAIPALLVMQGLILMVLGTGAVAGGVARERTYRLLDYQRLTPMSPSVKILGTLIGLPIREYFMFALSLPFVFYAAWKGGLSFGILFNFYLVFLSSALVYHMTGLAAGMVVSKPWQAGTVSQGMVVVLYLMLPNISYMGFTFFEFLTARPVFYGLVNIHLLPDWNLQNMQPADIAQAIDQGMTESKAQINMARYKSVAFFGMSLSPVVYSLAVQGFALLSLYVIVYRKWQRETSLPFSKTFAITFFALAQIFLVGSVLPFLANDVLFERLTKGYDSVDNVDDPKRTLVLLIFIVNFTVSGCAAILAVFLCTPNGHRSLAGLRRNLRMGKRGLNWHEEGASALPVVAACIMMSYLGFLAVYRTASNSGRIGVDNTPLEFALPLILFAAVLVAVHQIVEQFSERIFVMALFLFWVVPVLTALIVATAAGQPVMAVYIALFFPFVAIVFGSGLLMSDVDTPLPDDIPFITLIDGHLMPVTILTVLVYTLFALTLLLMAWRRWRKIKALAGITSDQAKGKPIAASEPAEPVPAYATVNTPPSQP